ncbi:MAG: hypothetical protein J6A28_04650, partial [Clostridia bacterium]|nr:hypothetical protein [Clostridia bacterium]
MEQNKKSSNKKMLIALTTLCVAFLFVCGAMIGVFAATAQTVNSGFKVQYSIGDNIAATVSVEHTLTGGTPAKSVNFTAATGEQVFALEPADATLSPDATEVVYTFTFKNDSEVPFT